MSALSGCAGVQSITPAAGAHDGAFNTLFVVFLVVCGVFYLFVIAFLAAAILRRHREGEAGIPGAFRVWVGVVTVTLIGLAFASWITDRAMANYDNNGEPVRIRLTANQWWWDVQYLGANPSDGLRTANELHLPAGRPAHIELQSNDVIHSFWVPNLAGKQDMIPGRTIDIAFLPRKAGTYRSQCAEYCGAQHAHMALTVTVEPEAQFRAWWARQQAEAPAPNTPTQQAGLTYFTTRECATCHNISGTSASAQVAPDLTHIASRPTIAAGTMKMSRGALYAWLADPQGVKPGTKMPYIGLQARELDALVAYLETLK
ncbi:c-type cytochrome [Sphingomonas tabacisoli]|uniref:C-type cytochrome n=1 Tax=Sphingomonas tabacisoli TaxID=2249466 RepID=A0ABW4I4B2_9SPHN